MCVSESICVSCAFLFGSVSLFCGERGGGEDLDRGGVGKTIFRKYCMKNIYFQ